MIPGKQVAESTTALRGAVELATPAETWAGTTVGGAGPLVPQADSILLRREDPAGSIAGYSTVSVHFDEPTKLPEKTSLKVSGVADSTVGAVTSVLRGYLVS